MTYDADNRLLTYNGQTVEYDAEGNGWSPYRVYN